MARISDEKLKARLLKARAALRAYQKREREKRKKQEEVRNRQIGRIVLQMVEHGAYPRVEFMADLDRFLSDPRERALFGLPPREAGAVKVVEQVSKRGGYMKKRGIHDQAATD